MDKKTIKSIIIFLKAELELKGITVNGIALLVLK
jgi:hypothetical protein